MAQQPWQKAFLYVGVLQGALLLSTSQSVGQEQREQTVEEMFSYKAPSGMFGDGTTKWQHFRFFFEERERMMNARAGRGFVLSSTPSSDASESARPGGARALQPARPSR